MTHTAQNLLDMYWDGKIPIDPDFFAEKLGLSIVQTDLGLKSGYLDAEKKEIHVNSGEIPTRKRFTIAHELGHYCLGHGSSYRDTSSEAWYRTAPEEQKKEIDANLFAADLLMPAPAVKAVIDGMGIRDAKRIREMFDVSAKALYVRLLQLGYINA